MDAETAGPVVDDDLARRIDEWYHDHPQHADYVAAYNAVHASPERTP